MSAIPQYWPPQGGDVWADENGRQWFAYVDHGSVFMVPTEVDPLMAFDPDPDVFLQRHPVLLYRKGVKP